MNVLVLSAGRRVSLMRAFQAGIASCGLPGRVFAADSAPELSAACSIADAVIDLPLVDDPSYLEILTGEAQRNEISLVVPTIDTELQALADARDALAALGIAVSVSDSSLVAACSDKNLTPATLSDRGIASPALMRADHLSFPAFVKPRDGSSSEGVFVARSAADLAPAHLTDPRYMFQQYMDPDDFDEFTVDLYFDRHSQLKCMIPRLRIETRGGEVSKGVTVRDRLYDELLARFTSWPGARGCVTLQVFANATRTEIFGIEVNPRFGGGYPLSQQAGARYPEWLTREYLLGEEIPFFDEWEPNLLMLRYDEGVFIHDFGA